MFSKIKSFLSTMAESMSEAKRAFLEEWESSNTCGCISMVLEQTGSACVPGVIAMNLGAPALCVVGSMAIGYFGMRWLIKKLRKSKSTFGQVTAAFVVGITLGQASVEYAVLFGMFFLLFSETLALVMAMITLYTLMIVGVMGLFERTEARYAMAIA